MRSDLPSGTVTFLFTDVEGSTRLLHELGAEGYAEALAEHRRVIREACAAEGGVEVDTQGDAFFFAFAAAPGAVAAAQAMTDALASGPIQVRVGLHTGEPLLAEEGYVGDDVHFAARVAGSGHGGQVVLSQATAELVDAQAASLGSHRLKDIAEPVVIYQLGDRSFPALKTIANSNLPTPASSFLGRADELYEADQLLQATRLLTVTGPGGAGKTRFALELATRAREERFRDYEHGVFAAFLSSLRDPDLVPVTIAVTLGIKEQPGQSALDALVAHLHGKRFLLLLDNLEHLPEAFPQLSELLSRCPGLTLLCTSRVRLQLQGERFYELPPLRDSESVSLFCERSQLEASTAIAELCQKLEGLPLAIELAAARTSVLSPEQISTRLSQRLDLLKGGPDRDPRQETLRATIQWSFDLLTPEEQRLFARLSVFQGGCTLEAAEEVCEADLDALQALVDKSLVRFSDGRYWMLETIREFALERQDESVEAQTLRERQASWILALAIDVERQFATRGPAVELLASEMDNFRAALAWAGTAGRPRLRLELVGHTWPLWVNRGHFAEVLRWVESSLEEDVDDEATRAKVLRGGAMSAFRLGQVDTMRAYAEECVVIARSLGDGWTLSRALTVLGIAAGELDEHQKAVALYREALAAAQETGDSDQVGIVLNNLGDLAMREGDYAAATQLFEEAAAVHRSLGGTDAIANDLGNLALALYLGRRDQEAVVVAKESIELAHAVGNIVPLAYGFALLAAIACQRGENDEAARFLGFADAARQTVGLHFAGTEGELHASTLAHVDRAVGASERTRLEAEGHAMSLDEAVAYALASID